MSEDTNKLGVYGYAVMYRLQPGGRWLVDQDDEYRTLPAHYLSLDEALDRVGFMRLKKVEARVAAIVAETAATQPGPIRSKRRTLRPPTSTDSANIDSGLTHSPRSPYSWR